ncbi:MAG: sigma-70 family RNA polymerase sigma factor [Alphaproteobacteria bacterium]|nr:sigma-70 family RNA polymerase sigma factor [Alphaproteobacteria bacterium]
MEHQKPDDRQASQIPASLNHALVSDRKAFLGFLIKRLGNTADAEDVLQDFCIRVLACGDQLRDVERMDAWLYSILRSSLNDFYRKNGRRERLGEAYAMEPKEAQASIDASETFAHICACVQELVPELRPADANLIRKIDIEEGSRKSVAAGLGVVQGTLAVRLHRARVVLRDRLLGHCGFCCEDDFEDCSCAPGEEVAPRP